ncbi:MAG: hypothetical protein IKS85_02040 [Lachnospiraceae bacterium]|nr:hypothetical protein [Lachnospiraceae bacterium]
MKISETGLAVCCKKRGKKKLLGFEDFEGFDLGAITEEKAGRVFGELMDCKLIDMDDKGIQVNPLGKHVVRMMTEPDVFITLMNETSQRKVRVYLRNTYYLCVLEDMGESQGEKEYTVDYLPDLKLVIGSFIHALKQGTEIREIKDSWDFQVSGKGLDKEGKAFSELTLYGDYEGDLVAYQLQKMGEEEEQEEGKKELSSVVNMITTWMFDMISKTDKSEVE